MACYGFANKNAGNEVFEQFFAIIMVEAEDDRIYVKKAVNWALRNIGKRNGGSTTRSYLRRQGNFTVRGQVGEMDR